MTKYEIRMISMTTMMIDANEPSSKVSVGKTRDVMEGSIGFAPQECFDNFLDYLNKLLHNFVDVLHPS